MKTIIPRQLYIALAIAVISVTVFAITANYYADAQMGTGSNWLNGTKPLNSSDIQQFQAGMEAIMNKYGLLSDQPNAISRDDYLKMQGDMYDLMQKYGYNPGYMMGGFPGYMMGGGCGMYPYGYYGDGQSGTQMPAAGNNNSPSNQGTMETFPGNPGFVPSQI